MHYLNINVGKKTMPGGKRKLFPKLSNEEAQRPNGSLPTFSLGQDTTNSKLAQRDKASQDKVVFVLWS